MNNLQIFNNTEFGEIRTVTINNEPMVCLADVCKALELEQVSRVKNRLKEDGVTTSKVIDRLGREQEATFINEANLYKVIFQSRKESAERFTDWVTSEVLPSIRRTGTYNMPGTYKEALIQLIAQVEENEKLALENSELKPKADFFDAVADSKSAIQMADVSKVLAIPGFGRNNLFEFLREEKVLDRYNIPYQKYVDNGWFRVIEQKYMKNGEVNVSTKTLVYQKGVDGIRKLINEKVNK
jgi:prophage antirepressor-like protein